MKSINSYSATKVVKSEKRVYKKFIQMYPDVYKEMVKPLSKGEMGLLWSIMSNHVNDKGVFIWDRPNKNALMDETDITEGTLNNMISKLHKYELLVKGFDSMRFLNPILGFRSTPENRTLMTGVFCACGIITRKDMVLLSGCTWIDKLPDKKDKERLYTEYTRTKIFVNKSIKPEAILNTIAHKLNLTIKSEL